MKRATFFPPSRQRQSYFSMRSTIDVVEMDERIFVRVSSGAAGDLCSICRYCGSFDRITSIEKR